LNTGKALTQLQEDRGMTSAQLARDLGVSRQAVHKWRSGDSMKFKTVIRICEALDVNVQEFVDASK